jgi:hypothetical protein
VWLPFSRAVLEKVLLLYERAETRLGREKSGDGSEVRHQAGGRGASLKGCNCLSTFQPELLSRFREKEVLIRNLQRQQSAEV